MNEKNGLAINIPTDPQGKNPQKFLEKWLKWSRSGKSFMDDA